MKNAVLKILLVIPVLTSIMLAQEKTTLSLNLIPEKLPFGLVSYYSEAEPDVSLVLSGGGARGLAHIGVLRALKEKNIPVKNIVGTSMGSIVGGLYSAGYSVEELDSIARNTPWGDFFSAGDTDRREQFFDQKITNDKALFAIRLDGLKPILPTSVSSGQKVTNFLTLLTLNAPIHTTNSFDDLLYNFRSVCTDLVNGEKVVIENGSLGLAMRASSSVTFLLTAVEIDSLKLVDGGLVSNIPVRVAKELNSDFIIASDVTSPLNSKTDLNNPLKVADQLLSIPMLQINKAELAHADVIVKPVKNGLLNTSFDKADSLISNGYIKAKAQLKLLAEKYKEQYYKNISVEDKKYSDVFFISSSKRAKNHFEKLKSNESISSKDLIYELGELNKTGDFSSLSLEIIEDENTKIFINAEENPLVKNIIIKECTFLPDTLLEKITNKLLNNPYNSRKIVDVGLSILHKYRHGGISLAEISSVKFNEENGELTFTICEKIVREIVVSGNHKTNAPVILREFPLNVDDYLNINKLKLGLTNLRATDLFENVDVRVESEGKNSKLNIFVKEKISSLVRFGLRIDNEDLTQVSLDIRDENVFGTGTEFGAILFYGDRKKSFIFEHRSNRIFDTYLTYKIRGYFKLDDVNVYEDVKTERENRLKRARISEYRQLYLGGSFGIGAQFQKFGNIFVETKYEKNELKNKFDFPEDKTYDTDLASLKFSLSVDSQNEYPYPTFGSRLTAFYETGLTYFNASTGFTKFYFDYKGYFSMSKRHTIVPKFVFGFADETLPLSQQFSLGGQDSFFGLREDEYRGRQIFSTSLEYQFAIPVKLFFDSFFRVRYDLGSIWSKREEIRFKDLRHGIGATLSLDTPIGPADFSVGRSFTIERNLLDNVLRWGQMFFYFTIGYYY